MPTQGDELTITVANYEIGCDEFKATPPQGVLIALTFMFPPGQHPSVGTYPWPGLPHADGTTSETELKNPIVIPVVRQGSKSFTLLPGGSVDLQQLNLEHLGQVRGAMRLEQSGGDGWPATRLFGSFTAKLCRSGSSAGAAGQ